MNPFPIYNCTWHEPADPAPAPALPAGLSPIIWTGNRSDVWSNPVTPDQVRALAVVAKAGGSHNWRLDNEGVQTIGPGGMVMLDVEGTDNGQRADAEVRRITDLYRWWFSRVAGPKSSPSFMLYALRLGARDQTFTDGAARAPAFSRGYETRATEIADLVPKLPALCLETYLYEPLATWLECRRAECEAVHRAYPSKPVIWLVRGDVGGVPLPDDVRSEYVRSIRNAASGAVVWGERKNNAALMADLAAAR